MNMHRRTTVGLKLLMLFVAACTFLISPVLALASEVDSLLNSSHETSWAYYRDPSQNAQSVWYISEKGGTTYGLGHNNSGHGAWVAIANRLSVANLDFLNKKVSLNSSTAAWTSSSSYLTISLVDRAEETVYGSTANQWANLIAGNTLNMDWYFFQSAGIWYIVWLHGTDSTILKFGLNAAQDNYAWQKPLDASGVGVDTANWTKTFFQENGVWKVRFQAPNGRISFDAFITKWNSIGIDYDGYYGNQCMDLMLQYNDEVLGIVGFGAPTAYEAYLKGDSRFEKIPNTGTNLPQKGDLVFWRQTDDNFVHKEGHVAMFIEGDRTRFSSFDQNWPVGSPSHVQDHSKWEWVAGWLHPK